MTRYGGGQCQIPTMPYLAGPIQPELESRFIFSKVKSS
jgi:hypothetical protein